MKKYIANYTNGRGASCEMKQLSERRKRDIACAILGIILGFGIVLMA